MEASTRLRRTFHYPSESDDEETLESGMDEQDQETLISTLSSTDTTSTRVYTHILLVLPLAPTLLTLPQLLTLSIPQFSGSVAAIASLLASAYTLYFLPLPPVRVNIIHSNSTKSQAPSSSAKGKSTLRDSSGAKVPTPASARPVVPYISDEVAELLARHIVPANAALCVWLAILEVARRRSWSEGMMIGGGYVTAFVMVVVMFARRELRVVDLGELERLRYRSRGG